MKIFNKLYTLIKEAIDPHNVKYNDKYIGQYIKEKDDHFKYTFNLKLSGHSLDQFDFRRTKTKNIFKHLKFNEAINLYKEKLIQSINSIVDNNHLIDIKYRSEQSFLIYCSKCYLGFILIIKNKGGNIYDCVVVTTFYFDNKPPISNNDSDKYIEIISEGITKFKTIIVDI